MANNAENPTGPDAGRSVRDMWIEHVISTSLVSAEVKVLLLSLAHFGMDPSGRVSIPREQIAERLRCHPRKVTGKLRSALDAGLLRQVVRGQKHRTAVYVATGVSPSQGAAGWPPETVSQGADTRPPESSQGADSRHPSTYIESDVGDSLEGKSGVLFVERSAASRRAPKPAKTGTRRKPRTPVPDLFPITEQMRSWAAGKGFTVHLDRETEKFLNHAKQNDRRCQDWHAAWRNWVIKAQEFAEQRGPTRATGTDGVPGHGPLAAVNDLWTPETEIDL